MDFPFGPFWSVKYINFGQKLPICKTKAYSRQSEITKNLYCFAPRREPKKISAHGPYIMRCS